ncbi:MAG TPA: TIM barrel protein [Pseudonocardiaceae bacterium]|nr:TIM barrel protein [Pseudonocardiaceae bacterium]
MSSTERRGIATVCLSGTLEDKLAAAAAAGFDGVEIFENDLVQSALSPAEVRKLCADLGLSVDLYQPFRDFEAVPPDVLRANLRRADRKFDLMTQLGADTMLVCSSVSPDAVDDDDLAAEQLYALAERAADRGLRIAYEALAWGRFVDTYDHSWRIVRRADHHALGVCLDSFHVLSKGSDPAGIRIIPGDKIFFLQLADAPRLHMDVLQWSRHHRLFPGQGAFDLTAFVRYVLGTGYAGPLSLEVFNDVFRQADPRRAAVDAMRSLVALQESVGRAPELRPAPRLAGHAFTELAVPDSSITDTLAALGFAHVGQHRSKPVRLWRQGEARVLVNESPGLAHGAASVAALAVNSADPVTSADRAAHLLAPVLPREYQADEADLRSVSAPDGTALFFCRTGSDADSWLTDFAPTGRDATDTLITGIDHVALTQPYDSFDEAGVFYRSVLGLQPDTRDEVAAPFGLIRYLAVASPDRSVRIELSAALLRRGDWAPDVLDPQHIAFATDDAIATAATLHDRGAPILPITDNYYDDLDARLALNPALLSDLRKFSILYDRDPHGGEFLHFCTPILGGRVFFEIVQRIGGYAGYGRINAPVGMAAHRRHRSAVRREPVLPAGDTI